jgi:hypothetical protein
MPIQRDDSEERIARLDKLIEEARGKTTNPAADDESAAEDSPKASTQAKAGLRKRLPKVAEGGPKNQ